MFAPPPPRQKNTEVDTSVPVSDVDGYEYIREYKNANCQMSWPQDHGLFLNNETFDK